MSAELILLCAGQKCRVAALRLGGECLVEEFLTNQWQGLPAEHAKLLRLLDRAAEQGPPRNEEKCRPLTTDIFEFKTTRLRVAWFWDKDFLIVCTHGWIKKSQKTPPGEIDRAEQAREAYFRAKREGRVIVHQTKP